MRKGEKMSAEQSEETRKKLSAIAKTDWARRKAEKENAHIALPFGGEE